MLLDYILSALPIKLFFLLYLLYLYPIFSCRLTSKVAYMSNQQRYAIEIRTGIL